MNAPVKRRALLIDRDGVINKDLGYVGSTKHIHFIPGIFSLCRAAHQLGYVTVVVTNQSGIGRGLLTEQQFWHLMDWIKERFHAEHAVIDAIYYCPYHPEHGIGAYAKDSEDRKPRPGMILRAQRDLHLDLPNSVLVGDKCTDIQAGAAAGVGRLFLLNPASISPACDQPHSALTHLSDLALLL